MIENNNPLIVQDQICVIVKTITKRSALFSVLTRKQFIPINYEKMYFPQDVKF